MEPPGIGHYREYPLPPYEARMGEHLLAVSALLLNLVSRQSLRSISRRRSLSLVQSILGDPVGPRRTFLSTRLRVVPHVSSGIVERAKRERAWKSPHARRGNTRRGDFHARSHFARSTIPEEKWGTTRSLSSTGEPFRPCLKRLKTFDTFFLLTDWREKPWGRGCLGPGPVSKDALRMIDYLCVVCVWEPDASYLINRVNCDPSCL